LIGWGLRLRRRAQRGGYSRVAGAREVRYHFSAMDEHDFRRKCDATLETLRKRLLDLSDEFGFDVEGEGEKIELLFEEPTEARFVISPNTAARQIWISALTTSFKLGWADAPGAFVLEKTGETLDQVMGRILTQQLGAPVAV